MSETPGQREYDELVETVDVVLNVDAGLVDILRRAHERPRLCVRCGAPNDEDGDCTAECEHDRDDQLWVLQQRAAGIPLPEEEGALESAAEDAQAEEIRAHDEAHTPCACFLYDEGIDEEGEPTPEVCACGDAFDEHAPQGKQCLARHHPDCTGDHGEDECPEGIAEFQERIFGAMEQMGAKRL